jgi:ATPase subunit of ABC transporter with duplicated ATPase domains|tara:strand:+ start:73 stop:1662 length:1590 start_codon:yes stop_codon:yes gene_type:complete
VLITNGVTMQFGSKPLFENVSVRFGDGNRYGLIGANGCGKSTFMKILADELEATSGNIELDNKERIAWLRQDQFAYEDLLVSNVVMMGHEAMWAANEEKNMLYANPEATDEDYMRAAELESVYAEYDGYTAESRAGELLSGVGIPNELHSKPMSEVPPGLKLRVLLAQVLFADPEILLLDEPTNNLDINTIRWLETILNNRNSTMIIISHDRHFLNQVCTHTADMDYRKLTIYPGNYDDFMEASTLVKAQQLKENDKAKAQIAELQEFVRRFSANASKAKQATSRAKQIDKIKVEEMKPSSRQYPYIRFEQDEKDKLYRQALIVNKLSHGFEKQLFNNVNFMVEAGEKIAIIGENGIGKSTLLKIIANTINPNDGSIKWAEKAKIGYFAQDHSEDFESDTSVFDWITQYGKPEDDDQSIKSTLGRLLFSGEDFKKKVTVLSGGEQGRMLFGKLMLSKTNILLLDEPTNHMDMESIESLNTALAKYKGTLFFVSHDREFVSSVATRILEIKSNEVIDFTGNYEDYITSQE